MLLPGTHTKPVLNEGMGDKRLQSVAVCSDHDHDNDDATTRW